VACLAAGALAFAAVGVSAQQGPSVRAAVTASATVLSPVGIMAPSSYQVVTRGGAAVLRGSLEVTSPAPHVVAANADGWVRQGRTTGYGPVLRGVPGGPAQEVRVESAPSGAGAPAKVTYVVAIIL
jgi:hypothetical protein